jgi:heparinase II/III-like protein
MRASQAYGSFVFCRRGVQGARLPASRGSRNHTQEFLVNMSISKLWQFRWSRLARMSWDELWSRGVQELAKRWDGGLYRLGMPFGDNGLGIRQEAQGSFFFAPGDLPQLSTLLRDRIPQQIDRIIEESERICQHCFDLLGYRNLNYGQEIDWHLDAAHGKRAPRKVWFKIRDEFEEVGDSRITWELSRHQHLVTLAKAYCLTGEERFASEGIRQWYHWQRENPYPVGLNWFDGLEVAFRSLSWVWFSRILAECPAVPANFQLDLTRALAVSARRIERHLSTYTSPNTHLLGEGVGLFFIGTLYPQLASAPRWKKLGWEIVLGEAEHQVQPDGMHFEQSLYYHVYALDFFLHARILAARNQVAIPESFDRILKKMLELLATVGQTGVPPRFGDDDGGRVFDPRRNRTRDLLDPLAIGAVIFGRADLKSAARGVTEEMVWLLGSEGVRRFDQLPSRPPILRSVRFDPSGICVMASRDPVPYQLVVDAGPQGTGTAGHGHADALSLQLSVNGHEGLVDPGTLYYVLGSKERDLFRGTGAHNTLRVDNLDQAESTGPFSWRSLPKVTLEQWIAGETFDFLQGSHTGYCRLPDPVVHRRWVFSAKSCFCMVRDRAEGEGKHELVLSWHMAPGFVPDAVCSNFAIFSAGQEGSLAFLPVGGHGWLQELSQETVSPAYGKWEAGAVLRFTTRAVLPIELAVVLLPYKTPTGGLENLGAFNLIREGAEGADVQYYQYVTPQANSYMLFGDRGRPWTCGPWASDAKFLYCAIGPEDSQCFVLCGGSYAEISGQRLITCRRPVERFEWVTRKNESQVFCSDESALSNLNEVSLAPFLVR